MRCVGIDVSKGALACAFQGQVKEFPNSVKGLKELEGWAREAGAWCLEPTGRFHELAADYAHEAGKACFVVNPARAKKYLGFVDGRAKTDKVDALALQRLGEREGDGLRPYKPPSGLVLRARDLVAERRAVVESRVSLELVAGQTGDAGGALASAMEELRKCEKELSAQLAALLKGHPGYALLLTIPGIGPVSAASLVMALERGDFPTSDSLVAYAGMDPQARDSGQSKGRRRLSHQGNSELRTALFMAARSASRHAHWKPYYQAHRDKGRAPTEATVILARKILRTAWSVYKNDRPFENGQGLDKKP